MFRIAVIGSGPGGFYTAQSLLKGMNNVKVDIFDKLPVPFGLVRYGIAPDHQDAKNVQNSFSESFEASGGRAAFYGNVNIDIHSSEQLKELKTAYDKVILATGLPHARAIGIPGEDDFIVPAKRFVEYYNGYPGATPPCDLTSPKRVVIIGNGNVSLDCARVLLCSDQFKETDISESSHRHLLSSSVKHVDIVGRRGIVNTSFTIKEFRDLTKLLEGDINVVDGQLNHPEEMKKYYSRKARLLQLICDQKGGEDSRLTLRYLRKPIEATKEGLVVSVQRVVSEEKGIVEDTGRTELLPADQILSSTGYYAHNRPKADPETGKIDGDDQLIAAGWLKFGPKGTVLASYADSKLVSSSIISDLQQSEPSDRLGADHPAIQKLVSDSVSWDQWKKIKSHEERVGAEKGKVIEKVTSIEEMLRIARAA
eukprot:TRINITY_DN22242_c0_g1_i1.p1 TRINITY_DN22242_c0_g1~~TRINITY_DN22242_c0_g1_i1.p1  ORF type:complete len:424 (+),score=98.33 TRINITY_DN22242_c0_g1_i1:46-1317(+)